MLRIARGLSAQFCRSVFAHYATAATSRLSSWPDSRPQNPRTCSLSLGLLNTTSTSHFPPGFCLPQASFCAESWAKPLFIDSRRFPVESCRLDRVEALSRRSASHWHFPQESFTNPLRTQSISGNFLESILLIRDSLLSTTLLPS